MINSSKIKSIVLGAVAFIGSATIFSSSCVVGYLSDRYETDTWIRDTIKDYYYYDITDEQMEGLTPEEISNTLLDPYSAYYTKEEYLALMNSNAGNNVGIGVAVTFIEGKGVFINQVLGNSPAFYAGLQEGEIIISGDCGSRHEYFNSIDDFINFVNTQSLITLYSDDGASFNVKATAYTATYMRMYTKNELWYTGYTEGGDVFLRSDKSKGKWDFPEDYACIKYSSFYGNSPDEMKLLVEQFNTLGLTTLIFDLRENGGGYVDVMSHVAGYMVSNVEGVSDVAMSARFKNGMTTDTPLEKKSKKDSLPAKTKIYVMANADSASASEALIGVLVSSGILPYENIYLSHFDKEYIDWYEGLGGEIKNDRTYGKGIMQSAFTNRYTGEGLKLTTAQIYWPNGKCIHDVGITLADGCKSAPAKWSVTYTDEELQYVVQDIINRNK